MKIKYAFFLLLISTYVPLTGCKTSPDKQPAISLDSYKIADGFELQLAAAEPLIEAPVAMDFDN